MSPRDPFSHSPGGGFRSPLSGPVPRDLAVLLGVVFATFSLRFFASTAALPAALRLTPAVWHSGYLWQLVTYPFIGFGAPSLWFLLELFILYMFGRDVLGRLGRKRFWLLLLGVSGTAALLAVAVEWIFGSTSATGLSAPFILMQGQRMLLVILVAAFATLNSSATILLFFVLPIKARWFLGLEIVFAFLGFLGSRDLAGFLGICLAVAATWLYLSPGSARTELRRVGLRSRAWWLRRRLEWLRRRRGIHLVDDRNGGRRDPWKH